MMFIHSWSVQWQWKVTVGFLRNIHFISKVTVGFFFEQEVTIGLLRNIPLISKNGTTCIWSRVRSLHIYESRWNMCTWLCVTMKDVWFDDDGYVWILCIQFGDYLMMWILDYFLVIMFEVCFIQLIIEWDYTWILYA